MHYSLKASRLQLASLTIGFLVLPLEAAEKALISLQKNLSTLSQKRAPVARDVGGFETLTPDERQMAAAYAQRIKVSLPTKIKRLALATKKQAKARSTNPAWNLFRPPQKVTQERLDQLKKELEKYEFYSSSRLRPDLLKKVSAATIEEFVKTAAQLLQAEWTNLWQDATKSPAEEQFNAKIKEFITLFTSFLPLKGPGGAPKERWDAPLIKSWQWLKLSRTPREKELLEAAKKDHSILFWGQFLTIFPKELLLVALKILDPQGNLEIFIEEARELAPLKPTLFSYVGMKGEGMKDIAGKLS